MIRLRSNQKKIVTMSDLAERPPRIGVKRALSHWSREAERIRSPLLRYGLSVICSAIAIGLALKAIRQFLEPTLHEVDGRHRRWRIVIV